MKHPFGWSMLVSICVLPFARGDEAPSARYDSKKMQGSWKPVTAELGGKPFPDQVLKTMKLVVHGGKYLVAVGERRDEGTVKLDPAKAPRAMDLVGTRGPNQGKRILAIYELTDTTLRVCYDLSGKARPKDFKTKANPQLFRVEYQRQKP